MSAFNFKENQREVHVSTKKMFPLPPQQFTVENGTVRTTTSNLECAPKPGEVLSQVKNRPSSGFHVQESGFKLDRRDIAAR